MSRTLLPLRWISLIVLACLCLRGPDALAQTAHSLSEALVGQPKIDFDAAEALFKRERYAEALGRYENAHRGSGNPAILFNVGLCHAHLSRFVRALQAWRQLRAEGGLQDLSEGERITLRNLETDARTKVARVDLRVQEEGAEVFLDGEPRGRTPLDGSIEVDLGRHEVRVTKAGFHDGHLRFTVRSGSDLLHEVDLRALPSLLVVAAGAAIKVDGEPRSMGQWQGHLPAGRHTIEAVFGNGRVAHKEVDLVDGQKLTMHLDPPIIGSSMRRTLAIVGASVAGAAALGTGGYFLFRDGPRGETTVGNWSPGRIYVPLRLR